MKARASVIGADDRLIREAEPGFSRDLSLREESATIVRHKSADALGRFVCLTPRQRRGLMGAR